MQIAQHPLQGWVAGGHLIDWWNLFKVQHSDDFRTEVTGIMSAAIDVPPWRLEKEVAIDSPNACFVLNYAVQCALITYH